MPERTSAVALVAASIRRERERAGLTLTELARRANIAKSTLSQLESGTGNPSVETLWALGVALDVPFSRLVETPRQRVRVIRAGEGPGDVRRAVALRRDPAGLVPTERPPRPLPDPGGSGRAAPLRPAQRGTSEHVVIGTGRALVGPVDEPVEVGSGDYLCYPGDEPHVFEALEPGTSAVIVMEHI